jgi:hypothetical protein
MADKSTPLQVIGEKEFTAAYEGTTARITITFSPAISGLLLSWYDCISLGILHDGYPRPWKKSRHGIQINSLQTASHRESPYVYDGIVPLDLTPDEIQRIGSEIAKQFDEVFDQTDSIAWKARRW